jgi:energy-coupling factor transport system substrate-specific component
MESAVDSTRNGSADRCRFYFRTKHVFLITTLACLGAAMSIVLAHIGAALRASTGFPGAMQALAGLHVLWLVLAALIVPQRGSATAAGLMKGTVELLLGSPHGLFVLLLGAVAGLLLDLVVWVVPRRLLTVGIVMAAALSAGSNVVLFQLFVRLPRDSVVVVALACFTAIAALSGAVFGGLLALALTTSLRRAGVITGTLLDRAR